MALGPPPLQTPTITPTRRDASRLINNRSMSLPVRTPNKMPRGIKRTAAAMNDDEDDQAAPTPSPDHDAHAHAHAFTAAPASVAASPCPTESPPSPNKKRGTMPRTLAETSDEDRLLLRLKDEEGRPWLAIEAEMRNTTGRTDITAQALRARHRRLKAGLAVMSDEDVERFRRIKQAVEEKFESEKWGRIAEEIVAAGGGKFTALALRQKSKELKI